LFPVGTKRGISWGATAPLPRLSILKIGYLWESRQTAHCRFASSRQRQNGRRRPGHKQRRLNDTPQRLGYLFCSPRFLQFMFLQGARQRVAMEMLLEVQGSLRGEPAKHGRSIHRRCLRTMKTQQRMTGECIWWTSSGVCSADIGDGVGEEGDVCAVVVAPAKCGGFAKVRV